MSQSLILTGERTVPGIARENYWFRRHEVAYEWCVDQLSPQLSDGSIVVDAGCGEGYGLPLLADVATTVIGLELEAPAAIHAGTRYQDCAQVIRANLDRIPVATGNADALVSMQVIEHLWDLRGFLSEVRRVLAPGATTVLATPNRLTFSPGLARGEKPTNPFHVEEFDADQLRELVTAAGLTNVQLFGVHHAGTVAAWEREHGSIVSAQIAAVQAGDETPWPTELESVVSQVTTDDFVISDDPTTIDQAGDLIVLAQCPESRS